MSTLHRELGVSGATLLGLGSILGTGVFVSLGLVAGVSGGAALIAVALAALLAACNALSSAQLAARHPVSGGTYEYGHLLLHPVAGFSAGWVFLSAKSASAATAALGLAGYLLEVSGHGDALAVRILLAAVAVIALTLLAASGLRRSAAANTVIVSVTILALLGFISGGACCPAVHAACRRASEATASE